MSCHHPATFPNREPTSPRGGELEIPRQIQARGIRPGRPGEKAIVSQGSRGAWAEEGKDGGLVRQRAIGIKAHPPPGHGREADRSVRDSTTEIIPYGKTETFLEVL